jgi:hypothetical protein
MKKFLFMKYFFLLGFQNVCGPSFHLWIAEQCALHTRS